MHKAVYRKEELDTADKHSQIPIKKPSVADFVNYKLYPGSVLEILI